MGSLSRRALLRALASAGVALPALELTSSRRVHAGGGQPPRRYVFIYCGATIGRAAGDQPIVPDAIGPAYDLKRALWPLGTDALPYGGTGFDVRDDVSVVSGLRVPWAETPGAQPPPGGKSVEFHHNTVGPIVSGVNSGPERYTPPRGPSHDQLVADALAAGGQQRSLSLRVQPTNYIGSTGGEGARISWEEQNGQILGVDPFVSPRLTYESLFGNFVPPDPAEAMAAAFELTRRRSALESVRIRTEGLLGAMGGADRERMQRHFDELAALEHKLDAMPPPTTGACELLPHPGDDPAIGTSFDVVDDSIEYSNTAAYSNEELRATLMTDYVRMAFACDLTRVVTMRMTIDQSWLNAFPLFGAPSDMHELSHGSETSEDHADALGWHVKHFARLISLLRDSPELDGSSLLDHTAVVLCFEGGFGYDPEAGAGDSPHSTENMVMLVGGRVGGLVHGSHVVADGMHPANVLLTAMQAVGVETDTLGEVSGTIAALRP